MAISNQLSAISLSTTEFAQQIINGLSLGAFYALIALGYTMVYGIIGLINFAHGEVVMIGAMVSLSVITALLGANAPLPSYAARPVDDRGTHRDLVVGGERLQRP